MRGLLAVALTATAAAAAITGGHHSYSASAAAPPVIPTESTQHDSSRVVWHLVDPTGGPLHASPVVHGETLLYSTIEPGCSLYCANASTGELLWQYDPPQRDVSSPNASRCGLRTTVQLGSNGTMLHGGDDNNTFFALDSSNGAQLWVDLAPFAMCPDDPKMRPCEVYSLALLAQLNGVEVRVQGSEDGHVRAWDAVSGDKIWDQDIGGVSSGGLLVPANGSPVLNPSNSSQVIIGVDDGFLHCLELATGNSCGKVPTCGSMDTRPSVDANRNLMFYTCYKNDPNDPSDHPTGWVGAINTTTLSYLWKHNTSTGVPLYVEEVDVVFIGYNNGTVAAVHPLDGSHIWVASGIATSEFFGSCIYDSQRSRLYCSNMKSGLLALDAKTGELLWSYQFPGVLAEVIGPAMSTDGQLLFVGDYHGNLAALRLDDDA